MKYIFVIHFYSRLEGCGHSQIKLTNRHKHEKQNIQQICHTKEPRWGMKMFLLDF